MRFCVVAVATSFVIFTATLPGEAEGLFGGIDDLFGGGGDSTGDVGGIIDDLLGGGGDDNSNEAGGWFGNIFAEFDFNAIKTQIDNVISTLPDVAGIQGFGAYFESIFDTSGGGNLASCTLGCASNPPRNSDSVRPGVRFNVCCRNAYWWGYPRPVREKKKSEEHFGRKYVVFFKKKV